MDKIKLGVVGLARGQGHVIAGKYAPHIEVTAVADLKADLAEKVAKEHNIPHWYSSLDELLEKSDCDAVVLATPIPDHAEHVIRSLKAGKHVLSEVTCCTQRSDLPRIAAAAREAAKKGIRYMLAENYLWIRAWTIVRNMAKAGLFGEIYYAESDYLMDFQMRPNFPYGAWGAPWRIAAYFGRHGHPYITHTLGPLANIMGEKVSSVSCMESGELYRKPENDDLFRDPSTGEFTTFDDDKYGDFVAPNTCVLMMQTEKGHLIRLRNSFVSARPDLYTYYSIQGTNGCYKGCEGEHDYHKVHIKGLCKPNEWRNLFDFAAFLPEEWSMYTDKGVKFDDAKDNGTSMYDSGCALMQDEFALAILNGAEMPITLEDALNWTAAGLLSHDSAIQRGMPVQIPEY